MTRPVLGILAIVFGIGPLTGQPALAQRVVPGTGTLIDYVGDTFENPDWNFVHRHPKSSRENNNATNSPMGYSTNRRWIEGPERGQPDLMKVVPTPAGGLPGSQYSLLLRTLRSGVPGRISNDVQQDDLIVNVMPRLGSSIRPSEMPNCVVRIYLPPPEQWENRSGPHFGFRTGVWTTTREKSSGFFNSGVRTKSEPYWPGMWVHFRSKTSRNVKEDSAYLKVRGDRIGRDFKVRELDEFGWWTMGMSYTSDGMVHYYASPGVDPLTEADHLTSQYPYSYRAERFRTFFFNVCNRNDGRSWSTPFVIDDPQLYVVNASRVQSIVEKKRAAATKRAVAKKNQSSPKKR